MMNEQFIRNDQYNFIKRQVQLLVNGHASVNDQHVIDALDSLSIEKVLDLFSDLTAEQKEVLQHIVEIVDREEAEIFLFNLASYIIPFSVPSEQRLKKLFPKVKKLKLPTEGLDYQRMTYLSFDDIGSKRRYIITPSQKGMVGLSGTYEESTIKQFCSICNRLTNVHMFLTKTKGEIPGTYTKKGNYICKDVDDCNHHVWSLDKLFEFVDNVK
jgi:hypothetical protein